MELKADFKVWNKELKKMGSVLNIKFKEEGSLFEVVADYMTLKERYDWLSPEHVELIQYTGFKDKNGKKIYFSDLEKFATGIFEVKWDTLRGNIILHQVDKKGTSYYMNAGMIVLGEKVGNKYENPKLLEGNK